MLPGQVCKPHMLYPVVYWFPSKCDLQCLNCNDPSCRKVRERKKKDVLVLVQIQVPPRESLYPGKVGKNRSHIMLSTDCLKVADQQYTVQLSGLIGIFAYRCIPKEGKWESHLYTVGIDGFPEIQIDVQASRLDGIVPVKNTEIYLVFILHLTRTGRAFQMVQISINFLPDQILISTEDNVIVRGGGVYTEHSK